MTKEAADNSKLWAQLGKLSVQKETLQFQLNQTVNQMRACLDNIKQIERSEREQADASKVDEPDSGVDEQKEPQEVPQVDVDNSNDES